MTQAEPGTVFTVWIVSPPGLDNKPVFDDVAFGLARALGDLGFSAAVERDPSRIRGRPIVLGAPWLALYPGLKLPPSAVIFNMEQIHPESPFLTPDFLRLLSRCEVWDYSRRNMAALAGLGARRLRYCGIGYSPLWTRIPPAGEEVDVLFYGAVNPRRLDVLRALAAAGCKVAVADNLYGEKRDRLIARSRIVLNLHFFPARLFEIVRVSYLLANKRFVVSERGADPDLETPFEGGVAFADYPGLVNCCLAHLRDPEARARVAEQGFAQIRARPQTAFLRAALGLEAG